MNNKPRFDLKALKAQALTKLKAGYKYAPIIFVLFLAIIYGYVYLRINSLNNAQPSQDSVTSQVQAAQAPVIDKAVVSQLNSLQNNSVSVQSLFNAERTNPF